MKQPEEENLSLNDVLQRIFNRLTTIEAVVGHIIELQKKNNVDDTNANARECRTSYRRNT